MNKIINLLLTLNLLCAACSHVAYHPNYSIPIPTYERPHHPVRVALVLGGGGSRSMAHVGVLEELTNAGIPINLIVGASAGGIIGALYADCPNVQVLKDNVYPLKRSDLIDVTLLKPHGLVTGIKLRRFLAKNLCSKTFEELQIPLIVVATDLLTGQMVRIGSGPIIAAIHASCAVPGIFCPVSLYGRYLVDAGVVDPIPVETAVEYGADIIIAIDIGESLSDEYPTNLLGIVSRSFSICYNRLSSFSILNADVVIKPHLCDMGLFTDKSKDKAYAAGREAARREIPKILELLENK